MAYKKPRPVTHDLKVKRSSAGLGLFAEHDIKKGDFVIEYHGPVYRDEDIGYNGKYLFGIDETWTIDGTDRKNTARYINHSCKPNCEPEIDGKRVYIYATKAIKAGEEITYDYGKDYFDGFIKPHGCRCGHHRKKRR